MLPVFLLFLAAVAIYSRMLGHDFLSNWDDNRYILENADVQGISWARIKAISSHYYVGNYAPLQMLSYMLDHALWGFWAGGYLLGNLILHFCNGLLIYRLLLKLLPTRIAAWFGAAIFLVHPVQVETVAWISQRKNLLAMLFFLLAWECYLAYRDTGKKSIYTASLLMLLLALLSKSIAVIFPFTIALFDWCYPSDKARWRITDKLPYLLMAVLGAVLAIVSQTPNYSEWGAGGGRVGYHGGSALATLFTMMPVFCAYIRLIVWPLNLSALYSPPIHKTPDMTVLAALVFLLGIGYLFYRLYRYDRRIGFWPLFAIIALLPVAQIVPLVTLMNDRYLYFPLVGLAALVAYAVNACGNFRGFVPAMTVVVAALSFLSFQRVQYWRDAATLWQDTVRKVPDNSIAWEALGEALHYTARPRPQEAIAAYRRAIRLNPGNDMGRYNLGLIYMELNDYAAADKIINELLTRSPNNVMGWAAYGDLAVRRMDYPAAEYRYLKALSFQPEAFQVHQRLGNLMAVLGKLAEARNYYLRVETIQGSNDPQNAYELARVEALAGDTTASMKWLETALQRGYDNFTGIMADEELIPTMSDERFAELVDKYFPKQRP